MKRWEKMFKAGMSSGASEVYRDKDGRPESVYTLFSYNFEVYEFGVSLTVDGWKFRSVRMLDGYVDFGEAEEYLMEEV